MRKSVEAIIGRPLPHGLLNSCVPILDVTDEHELLGVEWLALGCCPVGVWRDPCLEQYICPEESPGEPEEKCFCRPEAEWADPITVYSGVECSGPNWTYAEARAQALAALALGEQEAVEEGFQRYTLAPNADDLTPKGGPVNIAQGVAALEGCLAETYGGRGYIHVPAGAAALLGCCNLAHRDPVTGCLETLAGNQVVIGGGYSAANVGPDGAAAEDGTLWLYATGPVVIRRGPVMVIPDRAGASLNTRTNDRRVLAERTYVPAATCRVCAVKVANTCD